MGRRPNPSLPRAIIQPVSSALSVDQALVTFAGERYVSLLESSLPDNTYAKFSILAVNPLRSMRIRQSEDRSIVDALRHRTADLPTIPKVGPRIPFAGGWIGWVGYEAGAAVERVFSDTTRDLPLPDAEFHLYDTAAVFDHQESRWYAVAIEWPSGFEPDRASAASRIESVAGRLACPPPAAAEPLVDQPMAPVVEEGPTRDYRNAFGRAMRYIEAGDIYQVNLTRRFEAPTRRSALSHYLQLRAACPAPFGAFLSYDDYAVLSVSPELFLSLDNGLVTARPIKGTRPRTGMPSEDAANREDLVASDKDRAELNMIVDLLRNDIGRVCRFGSVTVESGGELETHPNVFHRVATIIGQLVPGADWLELLRATLPGGSITGTPKIRAMQIINELEPARRDVYCGSIGYIGLDGTMTMNIAIRTMVHTMGNVYWHSGGAIVADSNVESEWQELLAKASAMRQVAADNQPSPQREVAVS